MAWVGTAAAALTPLSQPASSSQLIHMRQPLTSEPFLAANTNSSIGSTLSKTADIKILKKRPDKHADLLLVCSEERLRAEICQPRDKIGPQIADISTKSVKFGFAESHLKPELRPSQLCASFV